MCLIIRKFRRKKNFISGYRKKLGNSIREAGIHSSIFEINGSSRYLFFMIARVLMSTIKISKLFFGFLFFLFFFFINEIIPKMEAK